MIHQAGLVGRSHILLHHVDEGIGDTTITEIENRFNERNAAFGEAKNVTGSVAREILESCK